MVGLREFDARCTAMQRQGRMGTFAPSTGQEAPQIGSAMALQKTDWVAPSFREQGVYLARGIKPSTLFLFFMGSEEGNRLPRKFHTLPYCVPCATQLLHAVGIGMAAKIKKDPSAAIAYFGDGASSEGDFHEALNFAGVYQTSTVFLCQNNQWAISTPRDAQTRSATLAQKAIAYGMPGLVVDGNDILAVYAACDEALTRARGGNGPSLLECQTFRIGVHTTSDDPLRYRGEESLVPWRSKDPIDRFEKFLLKQGFIQPGDRQKIAEAVGERFKAEAAEAEQIAQALSVDEMFTYLYEQMPPLLRAQMEEALADERAKPDQSGRAHG